LKTNNSPKGIPGIKKNATHIISAIKSQSLYIII